MTVSFNIYFTFAQHIGVYTRDVMFRTNITWVNYKLIIQTIQRLLANNLCLKWNLFHRSGENIAFLGEDNSKYNGFA